MASHGEILKRMIKFKGFTQEEFAEKMDISRVTVGNWTRQTELSQEKINQIARVLGITEEVFTKSKFEAPEGFIGIVNEPGDVYQKTGAIILHVPIEAEAGFIGGYISPIVNRDLKEWSLPGFDEPGYSFRVKGESMFPTFKDGEIVVTGIKHEPYDLIKREYVYVIVGNENILIKRVAVNKKDAGKLRLISDNPSYKETEINYDEVKIYRARRNISYDLSKKYPVTKPD